MGNLRLKRFFSLGHEGILVQIIHAAVLERLIVGTTFGIDGGIVEFVRLSVRCCNPMIAAWLIA